jgi:1,4-alpha-glucan branching enzyme
MALELVKYVKDMGFTHIEFLPLMEHPFYGSWGYQLTGYYAPTSRYGSPEDFMYLIDCFHKEEIGVILDWVPSHFPGDVHGLFKFDGTHLYEHADPRKGFHPDWRSYIFNYGRNEVRSFLISNAMFWMDRYHIDGLRVDAVASMLYLDYSRKAGEWIPNQHGGNENIEAITFLKEMNEVVYSHFPDGITIAEESTSWTGVSRPTYLGGLGFGQKWMMGWMHDTLHYFSDDPVHRKYHQNEITFSIMYAFTENFMLPLSHDEVVHGKGSLAGRMPGDEWKKFANLRLMYTYMFMHPGTKLLFMGGEFGQTAEWNHEKSLDWHLLEFGVHQGVQNLIRDLNAFYKKERGLYEYQFEARGFDWIDYSDHENSVMAFQRQADLKEDLLIVVCNFTPEVRRHYRIGVPYRGKWMEVFNSDDVKYSGGGILNEGSLMTSPVKYHGRDYSISLTLPPLAISVLRLEKEVNEFELDDIGT